MAQKQKQTAPVHTIIFLLLAALIVGQVFLMAKDMFYKQSDESQTASLMKVIDRQYYSPLALSVANNKAYIPSDRLEFDYKPGTSQQLWVRTNDDNMSAVVSVTPFLGDNSNNRCDNLNYEIVTEGKGKSTEGMEKVFSKTLADGRSISVMRPTDSACKAEFDSEKGKAGLEVIKTIESF